MSRNTSKKDGLSRHKKSDSVEAMILAASKYLTGSGIDLATQVGARFGVKLVNTEGFRAEHDNVPALNLPFDLLSTIFTFCLLEPARVPFKSGRTPWNISHVCSLWRQVALATPALWTNIHFFFDKPYPPPIQAMKDVLDRSGNRDLFIEVHFNSNLTRLKKTLTELLDPHKARLRGLSLLCTSPVHTYPFNSLLKPILEGGIQMPESSSIFTSWLLPKTNFPQLPDSETVQEAINHFALLISPSRDTRRCYSCPMVFLPSLTTLVLDSHPPNLPPRLTAPNITHLALKLADGASHVLYDDWETDFLPVLAQFEHLTSLRVDSRLTAPCVEKLCRAHPGLVELLFPHGDVAIDAIGDAIAKGEILPKLRRLVAQVRGPGYSASPLYLRMLWERITHADSRGVTPISHAVFVFGTHFPRTAELEWLLPELERMRGQGTGVVLKHVTDLTEELDFMY